MQFADHVCESAGQDWIENVFGKLSSDRERIRKIYEDSQVAFEIYFVPHLILQCVGQGRYFQHVIVRARDLSQEKRRGVFG